MKLKKLEINGFKSFYEKSVLKFPAGITSIVGPNGCGKSNVVDALRWVMGEQSVKQLRGKSAEDIIFSGANDKFQLNMAEVSLTIVNDNNDVPEPMNEYSEVMLTRRIHRSGESGYFLNKIPCRLKDIHNIFLGSGMGARSLAVIQQGNIGAITDADPSERRAFIEEAAGVTKYKARKKETLKKIESTNDNLIRVSDIIIEIKRQMDLLTRQAKKAELYKQFQDEIKDLDIISTSFYFDEYSKQIETTEKILNELNEKDVKQTSELGKLETIVEKLKLKSLKKNQEITDKRTEKFEIQRKIDKKENDLVHIKQNIQRLDDEIIKNETLSIELNKKNEEIQIEIDILKKKNISSIDDITDLQKELDEEEKKLNVLENESSELNREMIHKNEQIMLLVKKEADCKNEYQNAVTKKETLNRRLKILEEEILVSEKKYSKIITDENEAQKNVDNLKEEIENIDNEIKALIVRNEELDTEHTKQLGNIREIEFERNKHLSRYTTLKKMDEDLEWYRDGVKAVMKRAKELNGTSDSSSDKSSIVDLLADILVPEEGYDIALEVALGESLQYIIVNDQETGFKFIDYLLTKSKGRSGFIPINSIKVPQLRPEINSSEYSYLLEHIKVKENFSDIAKILIGHIAVTSDLKEALSIWNNSSNPMTIVTKHGNCITENGIMTGGSKDKLTGILTKKQELKNLQKEISVLDDTYKAAINIFKTLEDKIETQKINYEKIIKTRDDVFKEETEAEKKLFKISEERKHVSENIEKLKAEQENILDENDVTSDLIDNNKKILSQITDELEKSKHEQDVTTEKLEAVSYKAEEYNKKIVQLKLILTTLKTKSESSYNTLERLEKFLLDQEKQLQEISLENIRKKEEKTNDSESIVNTDNELKESYEELKNISQILVDNEKEYESLENELSGNDINISKIKIQRDEILSKIRFHELEQSQRKMKRDNIINRIEERYHQHINQLRTDYNDILQDLEKLNSNAIEKMEDDLSSLKRKLNKLGDINLTAIKEYEQHKERYDFLIEQKKDLEKSIDDMEKIIHKINKISQEKFLETFNSINQKLGEIFPRLFEGGTGKLILTGPSDPLETGVELMIQPPGKKITRLSLLSGGEKALSAIALIFSVFLLKPASFCIMDEIDAPLDDANVVRFNELVKIIGDKSQILIITHNKTTMEFSDILFGVTMEKKGISKIVSVNIEKNNKG